jgi:hypothetical protein
MDKQEQIEILNALRCGQQVFLEALDGITEALAAKRPGPERWSALECVEHVAVSEDFLLSLIMQAEHAGAPAINKLREAGILARGADRARPSVSPDAVRPAGRFANLSDAVRHFLASRAETIRYVENCSEDLRSMLTTHPLLGPVNCQETLLLIVVHTQRHARQLDEIRSTLAQRPTDAPAASSATRKLSTRS